MDGRHIENNPSDGLFKEPTQQGLVVGRLGHTGPPSTTTCLEDEVMQEGVTGFARRVITGPTPGEKR
jgi:hypothetical protein